MRGLIFSTILFISACSGLPSFYDDNESLLAVQVRYSVNRLDCSQSAKEGAAEIKNSVDMLSLYSESKKSKDIGMLIGLMKETTDDIAKKDNISAPYCNIKKKILEKQSSDIANAIMRRY